MLRSSVDIRNGRQRRPVAPRSMADARLDGFAPSGDRPQRRPLERTLAIVAPLAFRGRMGIAGFPESRTERQNGTDLAPDGMRDLVVAVVVGTLWLALFEALQTLQ